MHRLPRFVRAWARLSLSIPATCSIKESSRGCVAEILPKPRWAAASWKDSYYRDDRRRRQQNAGGDPVLSTTSSDRPGAQWPRRTRQASTITLPRGGYAALAKVLAAMTPDDGRRRGHPVGPARARRRRLSHRPQMACGSKRPRRTEVRDRQRRRGRPGRVHGPLPDGGRRRTPCSRA